MMTCNDQGTFLHRTFPAGQLRRIAFLSGGQLLLVMVILLLGLQAFKCQAEAFLLKVGFPFNGPVGDAGWNYAHEIARLQLAQEFSKVQTISVPSVPPEDAGRIMKNLIGQGVKTLVATDASFAPAVKQLAHTYPDRVFFLCNSQYRSPNVITSCSKVYQPAFLCGMLAAKMSSARHIAYLGELESPTHSTPQGK
ncbi:MAG: BMP family ABC transporter substrate-binding protein [Pedobacter sp.]